MPVVPFTSRPNQSQPISKVDPTFLMMAAAELHEAGRLVEPVYRGETFIPSQADPPDIPTDHPDFDRQNEEYHAGKDIKESNRAVKLPPDSI